MAMTSALHLPEVATVGDTPSSLTAPELVVDPADDRLVHANAAAWRLLGWGEADITALRVNWLHGGPGRSRLAIAARAGPLAAPMAAGGEAGPRLFEYAAEVFKEGGRSLLRLRLTPMERPAPGQVTAERTGAAAGDYHEIVGTSAAVHHVLKQVELVAPTGATVLITGESGTGKELIANAIHRASERRDGPLVRVNCAAVPRDLFESEFFGHVRGAYTGAVKDRVGRFEMAHGGTLFLDEVGEIPLEMQGKLLRVLQAGDFERVGEGVTRAVDVRVVAATNRNLQEAVAAREFREDLYYRLNVFPIGSVPLRERPEDIPLLASHFLLRASRRLNVPHVRLTREDIESLQAYPWPGNVRELENVVERGVIASVAGRLTLHLPAVDGQAIAPADFPAGSSPEPDLMGEAERRRRDREMIVRALEKTGGKVFGAGGAAELLGVKPTTLASRMKRMGIEKPGKG